MSENSYKDFIINNHDKLKSISDYAYNGGMQLYFGKDMTSPQHEICFARLHSQLSEKKNSAYYLLRLPYNKNETLNNMSADWIEYPSVLRDMTSMVKGVYNMHIMRSGFKNLKIIIFENKLKLDYCIDYSLLLILFCILRGMDTEYFSSWGLNKAKCKYKPAKNLFEYIYDYGIISHGSSGHDINDNLAEAFCYNNPLREVIVKDFVSVLRETMSTDKYLKDERYIKYFNNNNHHQMYGSYGYVMQTHCFNKISETTKKIILEDRK